MHTETLLAGTAGNLGQRIASSRVYPRELCQLTAEFFPAPFELVRPGSLGNLAAHNRRERAAHPEGERELYCRWQQGQYLHDMFSTRHEPLDNDRNPGLRWPKRGEAVQPRA